MINQQIGQLLGIHDTSGENVQSGEDESYREKNISTQTLNHMQVS